jgi:hypothetical protein
MALNEVLDERRKTHGHFDAQFLCAQFLKDYLEIDGFCSDHRIMQEALDQIAHKLSRIVTGNPHHVDHWRDIAGYAMCIVRYLGGDE